MAYTESAKKAIMKYKKSGKRARMELDMRPEDKEALQELSEKTGESKTGLIRRLIWEEHKRIFS